MNLDALIEDLEAQGYFESNTESQQIASKPFCKTLLVVRESSVDLNLVMPLLGKDFVAGFQNRNSRSSWLIVQDYSYLEVLDHDTEIQVTKNTTKKIIETHLIGVSLRLSTSNSGSEITGYIIRTLGSLIEFVTLDAKSYWIPIGKIKYLVVDKLSVKRKL